MAIYVASISPANSDIVLSVADPSGPDTWLNAHLWLFSNGKLIQLTNGMLRDSEPTWSRDGKSVYFTRSFISLDGEILNAGEGNIWRMDIGTRKLVQLTSSREGIVNIAPEVRADNRSILFTTNRNGKWQVFSMGTDGGNQAMVLEKGMLASESPDGKYLLYLDNVPGSLFIANSDGSQNRKIVGHDSVVFRANWSSDGDHIAYSSLTSRRNGRSSEKSIYPDVWVHSTVKNSSVQVTKIGPGNFAQNWVLKNTIVVNYK